MKHPARLHNTRLKFKAGTVEACHFLRRPLAKCYCRNLLKLSSPLVSYYCLGHYCECAIFQDAQAAMWWSA